MLVKKYKESIKNQNNELIKNKALTGLTLSDRERAKFLLFVATSEELKKFLQLEKSKTA